MEAYRDRKMFYLVMELCSGPGMQGRQHDSVQYGLKAELPSLILLAAFEDRFGFEAFGT